MSSNETGPLQELFSPNDANLVRPISDKCLFGGDGFHQASTSPVSQVRHFDKFVTKLPAGDIVLKNTSFVKSAADDKAKTGTFSPTKGDNRDTSPKAGRPWSKKETIFQNSRKFSFGMALKILGI